MNLRDFDGHGRVCVFNGWVELWTNGLKVWYAHQALHGGIANTVGAALDYCLRAFGYLPDLRFEA